MLHKAALVKFDNLSLRMVDIQEKTKVEVMNYLRHAERHGDIVINLEGIRFVQEIRSNPTGGATRADFGRITYIDGHILEVSLGCGQAVQSALVENIDTPKEKAHD